MPVTKVIMSSGKSSISTSALLIAVFLFCRAEGYGPLSSGQAECGCVCNSLDSDICESLDLMRVELNAVIRAVEKRTYLVNEVDRLRSAMDHHKQVIRKLAKELDELKSPVTRNTTYPVAQPLIRKPDDMQGDAPDGSGDAGVREVDDLVIKMQQVENMTMEVKEELKSERRVRRHLEEDLNETRSSVKMLGDRLETVIIPVDTRVAQVEEVVFSTLENMNKTLFEDHLQKLYYKVDGVVYKNETQRLDERLDQVEVELNDVSNSSRVADLAAELRTLSEAVVQLNSSIEEGLASRLDALEINAATKDQVMELENRTAQLIFSNQILALEFADVQNSVQDIRNFQVNIQNASQEWKHSLEQLETKVENLEDRKPRNELEYNVTQNRDNDFEIIAEPKPNTTEIHDKSSLLRLGGNSGNSSCEAPLINDTNLLVRMEEDEDGKQTLVFGCRPIGRYVLVDNPVPVHCNDGFWSGQFPTCKRLLDEDEIKALSISLESENPCLKRDGLFPDHSNCSRFFNCSYGRKYTMDCPSSLHFNPHTSACDYPRSAGCSSTAKTTEKMEDFVPPISVKPNKIDKPFGHMGTGSAGELIVHPGVTFTLLCLFPGDTWGTPNWMVKYLDTDFEAQIPPTGRGEDYISITLSAAREAASGLYTCRMPSGKGHSIKVLIKVVHCPAIVHEGDAHDVQYRPTPEGAYRVLGTTAVFYCEEGHTITAACLGNGHWSRAPPTPKECTPKKRSGRLAWGCPSLNTRNHPYLILEDDNEQKVVTFKCAGQLVPRGNSFMRCMDNGEWSHTLFPSCVPPD